MCARIKLLYKFLLNCFFPRVCICCNADLSWKAEEPLCPSCASTLTAPGPLICRRCGRVLPSGGAHCFACRGSKAQKYKCCLIRSTFVFNAPVRSLVHALKYRQNTSLAAYMGKQMAERFRQLPELKDVNYVVPVPLFPQRLRKRGFNQSELLARAFADKLKLPLDVSCLMRGRDTGSQTKLGRTERLENLKDAFVCAPSHPLKGKIVLLIDDVCTTSSTLEACAVALKKAGAKRVMGFTYGRE